MTDQATEQSSTEKKVFNRQMTLAPYAPEAGMTNDVFIHFDATDAQADKNIGRALILTGEGDNAEKVFGSYSLNKTNKDGKPFIIISFENDSDIKEIVLFKDENKDDGHNYFSGTATSTSGEEKRITANLVSMKDELKESWLEGYTFKKDVAQKAAEEESPAPGA